LFILDHNSSTKDSDSSLVSNENFSKTNGLTVGA